MDQIRKALAWLKRQHFWVLSVLIAVVALACWRSAAGTLDKEFVDNQKAITAEFDNQTTLRGKSFLPNQIIKDSQQKEIDQQRNNVEVLWKRLWDRQREHVLKWPPELGQSFLDYIANKKFEDEISRNYLATYRDYIDRHFESLPKLVKARIYPANAMDGGISRGRAFMEPIPGIALDGMEPNLVAADDYLCEWVDQANVRGELDFPVSPTSLRVWVTQENLWVYHTLLNVIANTNEAAGADRMSNAAVRTIYALEVGRPAALASRGKGRIELRLPLAATGDPTLQGEMAEGPAGGDMDMPFGGAGSRMFDRDPEDMGGFRGSFGPVEMTPEQENSMLKSGRYLDDQGQPIGLDAVGGMPGDPMAPAGEGTAPAGPDLNAPFKRLPIRMQLQMNQRWITHLISECASQPLQVEVTEVRINPPDMSGMTGGDIGMGGMSGGFGGFGGYGDRDRVRGGFMGRPGGASGSLGGAGLTPRIAGELQTFKQNPSLVNVEILGIIYIFNEPNPTALQQSGEFAAIEP